MAIYAGQLRQVVHFSAAIMVHYSAAIDRAVGDPAALGLIHVLADDGVAVLLGVVPQYPQPGGYREVRVLPVAGKPGRRGPPGWGLVADSCWFPSLPVLRVQ